MDVAVSVTAVFCAFVRGFHSTYEAQPIFKDDWALRLIPADRLAAIRQGFAAATAVLASDVPNAPAFSADEVARVGAFLRRMPTTGQVLSRACWAEDAVVAAARAGTIGQYVVLGAGFDGFALRMQADDGLSALRVFEVDAPATQACKRAAVESAYGSAPARMSYVPADLSEASLTSAASLASASTHTSAGNFARALADSGFRSDVPSAWSLLGLSMYLDEPSLDRLFGELAALSAPSSFVLLDYFDETAFVPGASSPAFAAALAQSRLTGEGYRSAFSAARLAELAARHGFSVTEELSPADIDARWFVGREDGLRACEHVRFARLTRSA